MSWAWTLTPNLSVIYLYDIINLKDSGPVRGYLPVAEKKTGAIFRLAASMGAIVGHATPAQQAALRDYAHNLGAAFQLRDDVLDAIGNEKRLGKPARSDIRNGRPSIVSILLCEQLDISLQQLARRGAKVLLNDMNRPLLARSIKQAMVLCNAYVSKAAAALQDLPESVHREMMDSLLRFAATRSR